MLAQALVVLSVLALLAASVAAGTSAAADVAMRRLARRSADGELERARQATVDVVAVQVRQLGADAAISAPTPLPAQPACAPQAPAVPCLFTAEATVTITGESAALEGDSAGSVAGDDTRIHAVLVCRDGGSGAACAGATPRPVEHLCRPNVESRQRGSRRLDAGRALAAESGDGATLVFAPGPSGAGTALALYHRRPGPGVALEPAGVERYATAVRVLANGSVAQAVRVIDGRRDLGTVLFE